MASIPPGAGAVVRPTPERWDQFAEGYDHPPFAGRARRYLLASTPRSGSHYLGHLLFATGQLGSPLEYLHPNHRRTWQERLGARDLCDTLDRLTTIRTSPDGWFGIKAHWPQLEPLLDDPAAACAVTFDRYLFVTRRDVVAQAVSLVIARHTGAWISFHQPRDRPDPVYDRQAIESAVAEIRDQEVTWRRFFDSRGAAPLVVDYETLVSEPGSVVAAACEHLGVQAPPPHFDRNVTLPTRQADGRNEEWRRRYLDETPA